tara:strand:- start:182 stop:970 length:789 start_codon:yes stop_codon:yes gene_type:complete
MYIGNIPAENYASFLTETFTVSNTVNYNLSHAVSNENDIRLVINNVVQQPGSGKAYTASGTTLTLSEATASTDVMYCVYLGRALQTVNPPNASVGTSQLADGAVTSSKLSSGKILQLVSVVDDTDTSITSTTYTDTGLTANITPISTSSKVLVIVNHTIYLSRSTTNVYGGYKLLRGSTDIFNPNPTDSNGAFGLGYVSGETTSALSTIHTTQFLDSPSSTSQQTYKTQGRVYQTSSSGQIRFNYGGNNNGKSVMTLMEVSG